MADPPDFLRKLEKNYARELSFVQLFPPLSAPSGLMFFSSSVGIFPELPGLVQTHGVQVCTAPLPKQILRKTEKKFKVHGRRGFSEGRQLGSFVLQPRATLQHRTTGLASARTLSKTPSCSFSSSRKRVLTVTCKEMGL